MYCNPVGQSYHSENAVIELFDSSPEPDSAVALNPHANWMLDYPNTPFLFQIGTLTQDFILKIVRKLVIRHQFFSGVLLR